MRHAVFRRPDPGLLDARPHRRADLRFVRPRQDPFVQPVRRRAAVDRVSERHREEGVRVETDPIRMREAGVFPRPARDRVEGVRGAEDAERADSHQRPVGLALVARVPEQAVPDRQAAVERVRVEPLHVGAVGRRRVVRAAGDQRAGKRQRHLGVVRRLSRERVERASVLEVADPVRIPASDGLGRLKLDEAAERVAGELPDEAAARAVELRIPATRRSRGNVCRGPGHASSMRRDIAFTRSESGSTKIV